MSADKSAQIVPTPQGKLLVHDAALKLWDHGGRNLSEVMKNRFADGGPLGLGPEDLPDRSAQYY
eukprot:scaffold4708_cov116-Skeletonema_marinoi.AAC.14